MQSDGGWKKDTAKTCQVCKRTLLQASPRTAPGDFRDGGVIRSDDLMEHGDSLTVDGSWWPVVCSGLSTCTLGQMELLHFTTGEAEPLPGEGILCVWFTLLSSSDDNTHRPLKAE